MNLSSIIGGLESTGLTAYEVSNGAPVNITQAVPGGVVTVGSAATTTTLLPLIFLVLAALVVFFLVK